MWRIKTPPGEKRKEVKKAQCEEKVPSKVSFYKKEKVPNEGIKEKKELEQANSDSWAWGQSFDGQLQQKNQGEENYLQAEIYTQWNLNLQERF